MKTLSSSLRSISAYISALMISFTFISCSSNNKIGPENPDVTPTPEEEEEINIVVPKNVVSAYVYCWGSKEVDLSYINTINYSFGHVNNTFDGIKIENQAKFEKIAALKSQKPELRIILAIGGWGSGGFSEMASTEERRNKFAADCKRIIDKYNIDGIDLDWEYPTVSVAGINSSPADTKNFTLLIKAIRKAIGNDKYLTFASLAEGKYVDMPAIEKYVNYINVMTYDMNNRPEHHSPLFSVGSETSCKKAIDSHINLGIPAKKLVLGIPFYALGTMPLGYSYSLTYEKLIETDEFKNGLKWNDVQKVPYVVDSNGNVAWTFDNAESIKLKCDWVKANSLGGIMYWQYDGDDVNKTLQKAVWSGLMGN